MRLLVTGGFGFIGGNYVRNRLEKYPEDVILVLDKETYASNKSFVLEDNQYTDRLWHHPGDICDADDVNVVLNRFDPDAIIHFAAESHVDNSIAGPEVFMKTNYMGTFTLLEQWRKYLEIHKLSRRFVHISTDEVFGHLGVLDKPFTEKSPIEPRSPYAASKAGSDLLALAYHETYGMDIVVTNCSNNYGPNQHQEKLLPKAIKSLMLGEKIPVYGNGENRRDWIHVMDHVYAIDCILQRGLAGERYCIGVGKDISNLAFLEKVIQAYSIVAQSEGIEFNSADEWIQFVEDRKGHDRRYAINNQKMAALGWWPKEQFEIRLLETVQWYVEKWCKNPSEIEEAS